MKQGQETLNAEEFVAHLQQAAQRLVAEHGLLSFFAAFELVEASGLWDLVVSASWLSVDRQGISQIAQALRACLKTTEIQAIVRILPLREGEQIWSSLPASPITQAELPVALGPSLLGDVEIQRGYILVSPQPVIVPASKEMSKALAA